MLQPAVAELMHPVTPQHCNTVFLHPEIKISAPKSKTSRLGSSTLTTAIWPEERKSHLQKCEVQLFSPSASFLFFAKQKRRRAPTTPTSSSSAAWRRLLLLFVFRQRLSGLISYLGPGLCRSSSLGREDQTPTAVRSTSSGCALACLRSVFECALSLSAAQDV